MGKETEISWCDHTWNPWIGCAKVSPACDHCYAEAMMDHRYGRVEWGGDRIRTASSNWREPLRWNAAAAKAGHLETVFTLSLGDIWDNEVDPLWRRQAFEVMEATPNLVYLLLSKRIGNAINMCDPEEGNRPLPSNAALGATMVNQEEWDRDIKKLREAGERLGARFTFASVEPMLGPINPKGLFPDWVICGGESGPNARPMNPQWVRDLLKHCNINDVIFHFKQWGLYGPSHASDASEIFPGSRIKKFRHKENAGRALDGVVYNGKPDLRSLISAP